MGEDSKTSYQPSLCANGCGFFGTAATKGLCSKCHRDLRKQEESSAALERSFADLQISSSSSAPATLSVSAATENVLAIGIDKPEPCRPKRCGLCNKKVGLASGFQCKCGITYCGRHRYPEAHECSFDFKAIGREKIAQANPVIKADKLDRVL